jgi:hypothetical protein
MNKRIHLSPSGELVAQKEHSMPVPKVVAVQEKNEQTEENGNADEDEDDSSEGYCDLDFPLGLPDKDDCGNRSTTAYSELDEDMCEWAAHIAHAVVEHDKIFVKKGDTLFGRVHPRGCFKSTCFRSGPVCY